MNDEEQWERLIQLVKDYLKTHSPSLNQPVSDHQRIVFHVLKRMNVLIESLESHDPSPVPIQTPAGPRKKRPAPKPLANMLIFGPRQRHLFD